ncbi:metabotropic glutamate receptor 3-like [Asterias rubens]|uniref:metabotropic glutamate receptor 3-like n=1 Tax=Asterias rubens TaxID=7604 RepID=UPI00145593C4|nr:metabotropic glutamate receptor 3-like [Asterias rubens]
MASASIFILLMYVFIHPGHSIHSFTAATATGNSSTTPSDVYFKDGDIILGGFFPLHTYDEFSRECKAIRESKALKLVEAMVYAVSYVNNNTSLLPGLRLGFEIYDSCYSDIWTLKKGLNFIPPEMRRACWEKNVTSGSRGYGISCLHGKRVAGVVGSQKSASSSELTILLGLYQIPQVSYLSTIDSLSKVAYPYFFRVVPSDRHQVNAIMDIVQYYGWTYVSLLFSDDEYGENGYYEFSKQVTANDNVCLAYTKEISTSFSEEYYDEIVANLRTDPYNRAVAVVLFAHLEEAVMLLGAVERNKAVGEFTFIASDGVGNFGRQGLEKVEHAAMGMITVVPFSERLQDFDTFFYDSLNANNPNPWTKEYLAVYSEKCDFFGVCGNETDLLSPHETLVIDSVMSFAHALNSMLITECGGSENLEYCPLVANIDGKLLRSYLMETTFTSLSNGQVAFDGNGDGKVRYKIRNLNSAWGLTSFKDVGSWEELTVLDIKDSSIRFYTNDTDGLPFFVPLSVCSSPCPQGYRKEFFDEERKCCWHCIKCVDNAIVLNQTLCQECAPPEWPDANRTDCRPVDVFYMSWGTIEGTVVTIMSGVAFLEAMLVLLFYFTQYKQRIMRRSDPVLCLFIYGGIILATVAALSSTFTPSPGLCVVTRMGPSFAYSLMFAPFAMKSTRLYRVFAKAKQTDSEEEAELWSLTRQLVILGFVWATEICISIAWIIVFPPDVSNQFTFQDDSTGGESVNLLIACNIQLHESVTEICFSLVLLFVTLVFSVLARQLPDNYHEVQFCAFASAGSMLVIVGAYAAGFGTATSAVSSVSIMYRSLGMIANSILMMSCIFIPKMYVIFFVRGDINDVMLRKRQSVAMSGYRVRSSTGSSVATLKKNNGTGGAGKRRSFRRSKSACELTLNPEQVVELKAISTTLKE